MDQYLSFITPSPNLFSLLPPATSTNTTAPAGTTAPVTTKDVVHSAFFILNDPSSTEQQIEEEVERIASGLFSVVVTAGKYTTSL